MEQFYRTVSLQCMAYTCEPTITLCLCMFYDKKNSIGLSGLKHIIDDG